MSATNTVFYPRATNAPTASLVVSSVAVSPAALVGTEEGLVFFQVLDADVMCTMDGSTTPTASVGFRLAQGREYQWFAGNFSKAKFIRQATTDARIQSQECYS